MNTEVTQLEIAYLKKDISELHDVTKDLAKEVRILSDQLKEIQSSRRWFIAMLSGAALAGALVDTILRIFRVY